jgi:hypothetical protein
MKVLKLNEFNQQKDVVEPMKSFKTQDTLCPDVWIDEDTIIPEIRETLMKIANDLYDGLELDVEYEDVILSGSLSNYNFSKYSDYDLHIVLDFTKVDDNTDLVKKYFTEFKSNWNSKHDIKIKGYEVELYLQDKSEPHTASGIYSLLNDKWNIKPSPFKVEVDEKAIKVKSEDLMSQIDLIEEQQDTLDYEEVNDKLSKVWNKIKKHRAESMEEGNEMGTGNLIFKLLRRNGYIEKIIEMKLEAYDKKHSID